MSNMQYETISYAGDVQILKREKNVAIPMTLDFTSVTDKDFKGKKIVKAGTPIGKSGTVDNTATVQIRCNRRQTAGSTSQRSISEYISCRKTCRTDI